MLKFGKVVGQFLSKNTSKSLKLRRLFSYSAISRGGHNEPPVIVVGPGGKDGRIPTDLEQAAGLERLQLLAKLEGREWFDMRPLNMTHLGTKKNPVYVESTEPIQYIGCTGFPVDTHDTIWLMLELEHDFDRCPECGSVFKLVKVADPEIPFGALLEHHEPAEPKKDS